MQPEISLATARNWSRLNVDISSKLTTRANKRLSKKIILPTEYFSNNNNLSIVSKILTFIKENDLDTFSVIYTIAIKQLKFAGIYTLPHVQNVIKDYPYSVNQDLYQFSIPNDERDFLGLIYQSILMEGEKNKIGSYYTPYNVVRNMTCALSFENNEIILDPCCGSGSFLLELNANPNQIFGFDNDEIAVFICKINLLLKYKTDIFIPQIYCLNFIDSNNDFLSHRNLKFDYIITNPPWGANCNSREFIPEITSKESFSYFFVNAYKYLKKNGIIRFLLPESVLNVKVHRDIRSFILNNGTINSITLYNGMFSGVTTHYVDIEVYNVKDNRLINVYTPEKLFVVDKQSFYSTENLVFNFQNNLDAEIIKRVDSCKRYTLKDSIWALGVVTGDNKNKLLKEPIVGSEHIYTGKEILPYHLAVPQNYIIYNRNNFQQVAKEEYYRADEKLVYKFISNKLVFAYDNTKSLFLNSANILIPNIPNMSIKTVLAFLNSEMFQYLYNVLFSEIKILKGNLCELPFPQITKEQDFLLSDYVQKVIDGENQYIEMIQNSIFAIYEITTEQKKYIKEKLNGTFNK